MKTTESIHRNLYMTFEEVMELLIRPRWYNPGIDFSEEEWQRWHNRHKAERKDHGPSAMLERLVTVRKLNQIWPSLISDQPALYDRQGYRVKLVMVKEHVRRRKGYKGQHNKAEK